MRLPIFVTMLLVAALTITACNRYKIDNTDLADDLQRQMPKNINQLHTESITPNADKKGVDILFILSKEVLTLKSNPSYAATYATLIPDGFLGIFCDGKKVKPNMHKYINTNNYINIEIQDEDKQRLIDLKLTPEYCKDYGIHNFDASIAIKKQLKQGFYDEIFLNTYYVPLINKALPNKLSDKITITHAMAGPGSKIYVYLSYKPDENESQETAVSNLNREIEGIYTLTCKNKNSRRLISMLDEFSWFGQINDKNVTKITASKTCN